MTDPTTGAAPGAVAWPDALDRWRTASPAAARDLDGDPADLLAAHHPDHRPGGRVTLTVGPNAGARYPAELARLLAADATVDDVDLAGAPVLDADVIVLGAGGAGCVAALTAADAGARVLVATKLALGDSNTVMAEGGIQAAVGPDDSLQAHYDDTVRGGHHAARRDLVAALVADGPGAIAWLIDQGMGFDHADPGSADGASALARKPAGGTTVARIHTFRDLTGLELMRVLREAVALHPDVTVVERSPAVELLTDDAGHVVGAVLADLDRGGHVLAHGGAVVLATGGSGRLHLDGFPTSNHYGATGDGLVLAHRAGARLADADSFQYHPTGAAWPPRMAGQLVSEAVRSAGAHLVNGHGERFVDELRPRDVVAAAILREVAEGRGIDRDGCRGVLLDTPTLLADTPGLAEGLPALAHLGRRAGVDPAVEPLLVHPTLHYQNGGVAIDVDGATTVRGLYAAGEVSGGIHGRNRLMGNALLELVAFGRRAGVASAAWARNRHPVRGAGLGHLRPWRRARATAGLTDDVVAPALFPDRTAP